MEYDAQAYMQCLNLLHRISTNIDLSRAPLTTNQKLGHDLINFLSGFELTDSRKQFKQQVDIFFESAKHKDKNLASENRFLLQGSIALNVLKNDLERDLKK